MAKTQLSSLLLLAVFAGYPTSDVAEAFSPSVLPRTPRPSSAVSAALVHQDDIVHEADSAGLAITDDSLSSDYNTLLQTVTTKKVPPDQVFAAMLRVEKQSYRDVRTQDPATAQCMAENLEGDWRPIFSNGTTITQKRLGNRHVNYLPIKFVISLKPNEGRLQNGIYLGSYHVIRITGTFEYNAEKRKFRFGFHHMSLLNGLVQFDLEEGQDTKFATTFGLGGHVGLWNILMADQHMMMARGAGQGLTLWKREFGHQAAW